MYQGALVSGERRHHRSYSAEMNITVARGSAVVPAAWRHRDPAAARVTYGFKVDRASFPGALPVSGDPTRDRRRLDHDGYFRARAGHGQNVYGQETSKVVNYFTSLYGLPAFANLTVVETENGAPNGYPRPACCS
jgi:hypothetical protein